MMPRSVNAILLLIAALPTLFFGALIVPNDLPFTHVFSRMAASVVGASASVEENPYNLIAQQLRQKESELLRREKELEEARSAPVPAEERYAMLVIVGGATSALLFTFLALNFYFDWRRNRRTV